MGLHLTQSQFTSITDLFKNAVESNEIEAIISKGVSFYQFQRLLSYLDQKCARNTAPQTLDITSLDLRDTRLTLSGIDDISAYCKTGKVSLVTAMIKKKNVLAPVYISEHDIVVRCNEEEQVTNPDVVRNIFIGFQEANKMFRLKSRISYTHVSKLFRIDCTAVKMPKSHSKLFYMSNIKSLPTTYEVEVEYIGSLPTVDGKQISHEFLNLVSEVKKVLEDVEFLLPKKNVLGVLENYSKVAWSKPLDLIELQKYPKKLFVGPQPVSFELKHLSQPKDDPSVSVLEDYTITHKADGERSLLFVDQKGTVYIINNRMVVKPTNITVPTFSNSIFDSEIITTPRGKTVFLFDTYFVNEEDQTNKPLTDPSNDSGTRLSYAKDFAALCKDSTSRILIECKEFHTPKNQEEFYVQCAILRNAQKARVLPFNTDGLIFTPRYDAVGAKSRTGTANKTGTWVRTLKWKPPEDNTIDFLVRVQKSPAGEDEIIVNKHGVFKVLELYVGKTIQQTTPWDFWTSGNHKQKTGYIPTLFCPKTTLPNVSVCFVPYSADSPDLKCNGILLHDDSIIEMRWTNENMWEPLRVRVDKTELYRQAQSAGGQLPGGTANDINVAMSVWQTIVHPVTEDILFGKKVVSIPKNEEQYYMRNKTREESDNYNMNLFHNIWIKKRLLLKQYDNKTKLMDFGCGKGGDLTKWLNAKYTTVLGLDLYEDNITNPHDGAYARLLKTRWFDKTKHSYVFLPFDVRVKIDESTINDIQNEDNKRFAKHVWGMDKALSSSIDKLYGIANDGFDIISCQFATHYFFENSFTLDAFCYNINKHLRKGGIFVGTCFDGHAISQLLETVKRDELVSGKSKEAMSWAIRKKYDTYEPMKTGQAIDVYVQTINQYLIEYIVDFNLLEEQLKKYNIRLLNQEELISHGFENQSKSTGLFSECFDDLEKYVKTKKSTDRDYDELKKCCNLSDTEKTFSFLNRWFVFIKDSNFQVSMPVQKPTERVRKISKPKQDTKRVSTKTLETKIKK